MEAGDGAKQGPTQSRFKASIALYAVLEAQGWGLHLHQ